MIHLFLVYHFEKLCMYSACICKRAFQRVFKTSKRVAVPKRKSGADHVQQVTSQSLPTLL